MAKMIIDGHLILGILVLLAPLAVAQPPPPPNETPGSPYGFNTRFNPSMAIIIVVLISAFFFMGFFSIYIRQCSGQSGSTSGGGISQAGRGGRSRRAARGLDPAVVETFPIFEYSVVKNLKIGKGTLECAVCLSEFKDDETLRLLPKCNHVFHPDCIDAWLSNHTTCPVCRSNLVPGPDNELTTEEVTETADGEAGTGTEGSHHGNGNEIAITIDEVQPPTEPAAGAPPDQLQPLNLILPIQNRPPRSKSTRRPIWSGKFPRSHSTGHSLVQPGENVERFTLRLPEQVRQELVKAKLNRTTSCAYPSEALVSDGSIRRGHRIGGEGSSRGGRSFGRSDRGAKSDRWVFSMAPPFFTRTLSVRSPTNRGAVMTPFDCLNGAKAEADSEGLPAPQRSATPVFTVETPPLPAL
ncbi:E3 ubiquitin-protein ligase ATL6-like [Aristolochia californica]|uniref:E3 ubiquitin-protein ligase ATL6-like n=1 Tax=Aristolochia californica TaxID=171875 RepID=UPI0035DA737C